MKMKKYNKIIKNLGVLVLMIMLANSCTKKFERLNTQASLLSEDLVTPEFLLTGVQYSAGEGARTMLLLLMNLTKAHGIQLIPRLLII